MTPAEQLLRHVLRGPGCWLWAGAVNNQGYAQVGIAGRTRSAHRVSFETFVGPIADGAQVDHTCHNADASCLGGTDCKHRRCINPAHLEAVSNGENVRRRLRDKCPNGHAYTPENTDQRANGTRICVTCRKAQSAKHLKGYGKRGRPSKAAIAALEAARLAEAS